jgi:predicted Rossmann fold nucleotide-binding protein DprA/Smf involved in DNA uptake
MQYLGNKEILKQHKIAFLCSRRCPAHLILKSYDWAIEQREKGNCIISGFHSQIEKDVFHYLLKGKNPIILALARGIKKRFEQETEKALEGDRLLIITPFNENVKRITVDTAIKRNQLMVKVADEIFIAYASKGGNLEELIKATNNKPISTFDLSRDQSLRGHE